MLKFLFFVVFLVVSTQAGVIHDDDSSTSEYTEADNSFTDMKQYEDVSPKEFSEAWLLARDMAEDTVDKYFSSLLSTVNMVVPENETDDRLKDVIYRMLNNETNKVNLSLPIKDVLIHMMDDEALKSFMDNSNKDYTLMQLEKFEKDGNDFVATKSFKDMITDELNRGMFQYMNNTLKRSLLIVLNDKNSECNSDEKSYKHALITDLTFGLLGVNMDAISAKNMIMILLDDRRALKCYTEKPLKEAIIEDFTYKEYELKYLMETPVREKIMYMINNKRCRTIMESPFKDVIMEIVNSEKLEFIMEKSIKFALNWLKQRHNRQILYRKLNEKDFETQQMMRVGLTIPPVSVTEKTVENVKNYLMLLGVEEDKLNVNKESLEKFMPAFQEAVIRGIDENELRYIGRPALRDLLGVEIRGSASKPYIVARSIYRIVKATYAKENENEI